jgi:hypothetical protein
MPTQVENSELIDLLSPYVVGRYGNQSISGDLALDASNALYFGPADTDGSWRIVRSGNNLVFERRELGVWNTKDTITP